MAINYINDHINQALRRLITQYKESPNIISLLNVFVQQIQDLEDTFFQLLQERSLFSAVGVQLDKLGTTLDQGRMGLSDDDYRVLLLIKISEINSEGTPEDLISIFKNIMRAQSVMYGEIYPAGFFMTAIDADPFSIDIAAAIMGAKPAGVELYYLAQVVSPSFSFFDDPDPLGAGFGDTGDPDVGGWFSTLIYLVPTFGFFDTPGFVGGFGDLNAPNYGGLFASV